MFARVHCALALARVEVSTQAKLKIFITRVISSVRKSYIYISLVFKNTQGGQQTIMKLATRKKEHDSGIKNF